MVIARMTVAGADSVRLVPSVAGRIRRREEMR